MYINARKIKTILAKQGITKKALAEKSGIFRQNISTIIRRGTCEPKTAGKLARALGVDPVEILESEV